MGLRSDIAECERLIRTGGDEIEGKIRRMVSLALSGHCEEAAQLFTESKLMGCSFVSEIRKLQVLKSVRPDNEQLKVEHLELYQPHHASRSAAEVWNGNRIVPLDRKMAAAGDHTLDEEERRDG